MSAPSGMPQRPENSCAFPISILPVKLNREPSPECGSHVAKRIASKHPAPHRNP
ncbi:hypothetical protein Z947_3215 [Sulfitobacter geojensis]|nr:hypothetical protein Z947_3215 [Sulfitobacter geojensis]